MRLIETPQDMQNLMRECIQITYRWVDTVNSTFGLHLPHYKVVFALKSGIAGKAKLGRGIIEFNPTLLRENPEAFLNRTPGHEVVHFAAHAMHGPDIDAHGPEWKIMMRKLGLPDTRCHNYDTSNVPTRVGKRINQRASDTLRAEDGIIKTFGIGKILEFD